MHRSSPHAQRGFSLLEVALAVLLIGSAITVGYLLLRARAPVQQVQSQEQALQWADQAILAYAARNAHLPCAVATPSSDITDCVGPDQKGWLPTRALLSVHPGGDRAMPPIRYMVYRGSGGGTDLAVASNIFSPRKWDGTPHNFGEINGLDLCMALGNAAIQTNGGLRGDRARTTDIDGHAFNVAYGLSAAGAGAGPDGLFDASNQSSTAAMESPGRAADARYDDRVRVRDFNSLAQSLGCQYADPAAPDGLMPASLDMLALAVDVSDEVTDQNTALVKQTQDSVNMAIVSEVFAVLNVALAAASISNSVTTLTTASAQLATAVATCPIPPFVACGLIPPYTTAVILGGISIGLTAASTALAAAALAAASVGLAKTVEARDMAKANVATPPADVAGLAEKACIAAEGGWMKTKLDADGKLIEVDPPYWKDGLKQEVAALEQTLQQTKNDLAAANARLAWLGEIPSHLIDYPPKPVRNHWQHCIDDGKGNVSCHTDWEPIADYNQRVADWLQTRKDMEDLLQPKLEAIRIAEEAYLAWETKQEQTRQAQTEYDQMVTAINQLTQNVQQCDANPPTELDKMRQCSNNRVALLGMTTCDLSVLTAEQVDKRQCLPWKQDDLNAAKLAEWTAQQEYNSKFNYAWNLPQPPIADYMDDAGIPGGIFFCTITFSCDALIIPGQHGDEDDKRETYAMTYYKKLGLEIAVTKQEQELQDKKDAYTEAQAQCDALRGLSDSGAGGGSTITLVTGADEILHYANCKGANGAVTPGVCPVTSGSTP